MIQNTYKTIEQYNKCKDRKYGCSENNIRDIYLNKMEDPCSAIYDGFCLGYVQGRKAALAKRKKKELVTNTLIKAGAKISDKGFFLLRDIVLSYAERNPWEFFNQKQLFSTVGEKYGLTYAAVQKEIRTVINNSMDLSRIDFLDSYFGVCYRPETGTVKPMAFILRVVDDVQLQCEAFEQKGGSN